MSIALPAVILFLLLTGCSALPLFDASETTLTTLGPQAWIDAPVSGQTLHLSSAPFEVVVHGNAASGVTGVELSVNGQVLAKTNPPNGSEPFTYIVFDWTPPAPGTYQLSARAQAGELYGSPAQVEVIVVVEDSGEAPSFPLSPTLAVESEHAGCQYTALVNLFCRSGPGRIYPDLDDFVANQIAPVVGILADQSHVQVLGPNFGAACFVPLGADFGQLSGDCNDLPMVTAPPPPTFTPSPTPEPLATSTPRPTSTPVPPQCSDRADNDGDGRTDLADRECRDADDNDEANR
ncbi:MAG: hypothetical protein EPO32_01570 [Anaerolineae bacterium]|nr:MAG: hypothetical protein EPO32_01570 [Anaerolineae bacterium]